MTETWPALQLPELRAAQVALRESAIVRFGVTGLRLLRFRDAVALPVLTASSFGQSIRLLERDRPVVRLLRSLAMGLAPDAVLEAASQLPQEQDDLLGRVDAWDPEAGYELELAMRNQAIKALGLVRLAEALRAHGLQLDVSRAPRLQELVELAEYEDLCLLVCLVGAIELDAVNPERLRELIHETRQTTLRHGVLLDAVLQELAWRPEAIESLKAEDVITEGERDLDLELVAVLEELRHAG